MAGNGTANFPDTTNRASVSVGTIVYKVHCSWLGLIFFLLARLWWSFTSSVSFAMLFPKNQWWNALYFLYLEHWNHFTFLSSTTWNTFSQIISKSSLGTLTRLLKKKKPVGWSNQNSAWILCLWMMQSSSLWYLVKLERAAFVDMSNARQLAYQNTNVADHVNEHHALSWAKNLSCQFWNEMAYFGIFSIPPPRFVFFYPF